MPGRLEMTPAALPVVAIVGRPNVGKSTLFNRLVRARRAIVDNAPGVTRDRVVARASHGGRSFTCVDTGGFLADDPRDPGALAAQVRAQALAAIEEADCVVCVLDGAAGLAPADRDTVRLLARSNKPVLFVVNKIDTAGHEARVVDFHAAGVDQLLSVSAAHGRGLTELLDAVVEHLPVSSDDARETAATRLALVGRPNVGKSSLLNRLLGATRALVAAEAGTTRDATDTPVRIDGRPWVLIDTAGIRRRGRVHDALERHGAVRALGVLERTDLVCVVLDASEGMTDQDARLVGKAWEAGRGVILLANKWDLLGGRSRDVAVFRRGIATTHPAFAGLPIVCVSAHTGEGLEGLFGVLNQVDRAYRVAMPTPELNRVLRAAVTAHPPPGRDSRPIRLFYVTQTHTAPPEVTVFASAPAHVPEAYRRYLRARFNDAFSLVGVPLRVRFRARREEAVTAPRTGGQGRRSSPPRSAAARGRRR